MGALDLPRTRAVASRLDVAQWTFSTNADLVAAAASAPDQHPHLSVIVTDDQRAGRGRLGRTWTAPAGAALAVSVLLRVPELPDVARGWLPLAAGLAMTEAVQARGTTAAPAVKWPNDVLIAGRKVCGILAEMVPGERGDVVVGAGINTRMTRDQLPVPAATSLALEGADLDDDALVADYLGALTREIDALVAARGDADRSGLRARVIQCCATLGRDVRVMLPGGAEMEGVARDIREDGMLVIDRDGVESAVAAGDVIHVR